MFSSSGTTILRTSILAAATLVGAKALHIGVPRQAPSISWSACPDSDTTQCAFFDVPREYENATDSDTVSIFMRRYPANASQESRLGSILVNPGGPGGSGNLFIAAGGGEKLSAALDGRYDIIGFDPRGVNLTGPWTACFATEAEPVSLEYQEILQGAPYPHSTDSSDQMVLRKLRAIQASHNAACVERGNRKILESVGTAFVAQDMARIVEALGEDGLNFLGYSYGTILGATFAAMRPDLVKRMLLDGVSNAESYYNDVWKWGKDGMDDTQKTLDGFLSTCAEAGPEYCAFAAPPKNSNKTQTTESLRRRLNAIYTRLDRQPMSIGSSLAGPGVFTASNLQRLLLGILYSPRIWSVIMQGLASLEQGNATDAYTSLFLPYQDANTEPYDQNVFNRSMQRSGGTRESLRAILCSDAAATNISVKAHADYYREIGKISSVGEQWANLISACNGWSFRASQRYTGPWTVAKGLKKTRFPILFISLDADPVTPLSSAVKMAKGFGNESATLLIQQGYGHPSNAHPSLCTIRHMRDYFLDGKVPTNGTHCTPEPGFIYPTNTTNSKRAMLDKRDKMLLEAVEGLSEARSKLNLATWGF
ncbi:alpha/beta hydrolase family protein [Ceratobasidium sp. AG-Ba]|nr:alpha/beta hydrolase family protein [Ceratobasidium sp. AG-Ba]